MCSSHFVYPSRCSQVFNYALRNRSTSRSICERSVFLPCSLSPGLRLEGRRRSPFPRARSSAVKLHAEFLRQERPKQGRARPPLYAARKAGGRAQIKLKRAEGVRPKIDPPLLHPLAPRSRLEHARETKVGRSVGRLTTSLSDFFSRWRTRSSLSSSNLRYQAISL